MRGQTRNFISSGQSCSPTNGAIDPWFIRFSWVGTGWLPEPKARVESSRVNGLGTASLGSGLKFLVVLSHDLPSYHFALQLSFNHICATFSRLYEILSSFWNLQKLYCYCTSLWCWLLNLGNCLIIQSLAFLELFLQFHVGLCYSSFTIYSSHPWACALKVRLIEEFLWFHQFSGGATGIGGTILWSLD